MICDSCKALYDQVGSQVRAQHVFADIRQENDALICQARDVEVEATYRVTADPTGQGVWVGLYTPDRWLSGSIETDLVHLGDKLEDLLEEELCDQGYDTRLPMEHFRDDDKQYVFRSPVEVPAGQSVDSPATIDRVARVLLAFEAMFRQLGDMAPGEDEE